MPLDWKNLPDNLPFCDIGLGSDIFYSSEDFDDIMAVIATLVLINPRFVFYTAYQMRR